MSNSRPLALCSVMTCTRGARSRVGVRMQPRERSRRAPANRACRRATSCAATSAKNRSAASRSIGSSSVAPPPSASHAPRTRSATPARPRASSAGASTDATRAKRVPALGRQAVDRLRRVHQRGDRAVASRVGGSGNGEEVRQHEPAPRRAQHGEPGEPIGGLHERVRQRHEIEHGLPLAERRRARPRRTGSPPRAAPAGARRDARARGPGSRRSCAPSASAARDVSDDRPRFVLRVGARPRSVDRAARARGAAPPRRGTKPTTPRHGSLRSPSTLGNTRFVQSTSSGLRAEIAPQDEDLDRHVADATACLRLEEQPHLGVAEAVDRLHRIADREQRAAVARLPARGQPAIRSSCAKDVSWNSSTSRCAIR